MRRIFKSIKMILGESSLELCRLIPMKAMNREKLSGLRELITLERFNLQILFPRNPMSWDRKI